ncbi:NAD(P)/FAD-dependent oxidoreductase [Adhaeribacter aquaticus]|uniref:NAD(P)/FAD-dependent oxidoreductase n=1 Tax=Adhaeribacter aquaticus TaxID=299567 RepID=UPI000414D14E|nr:FAD-dependent oxidoreductase [Adhaeribacter aquaticus]
MLYDFLLIGHGLAGSILAETLSEAGYKILVIDTPKPNSASNVAAGLMNPLAGKRFAKSWLADTLVPFATSFYQDLEARFNQQLFYPKPILKLFSSVEEQNNWMGKSAGTTYGDFIKEVYTSLPASDVISQEKGGILIDKGGYVLVPVLLEILRVHRLHKQELITESFEFIDLQLQDNYIKYQDIEAKEIIFCEGYKGAENPFFKWLPFSLNKGEVLDVKALDFPDEYIYNKAVYVVGAGAERVRIGATYNWRQADEEPTETGREELLHKAQDLIKKPLTVVAHKAGIRPAVRDRRPLIGSHPEQNNVKIFNGMGSKGVMMAPYLASHFAKVLEAKEDLLPEVNISRYFSLLKEHKKLQ